MNPRALRILTVSASLASALALLAACGGGGGGQMTGGPPDNPDPTDNGQPTDNGKPTHPVQPTPGAPGIELVNATAADLRDHWHEAGPLTGALDLEPAASQTRAAGLTRIRARLADVDPSVAADWRAALAAGRVAILGTRDGYVVASAAGGPAGHLDIRFDYAQAPSTTAANRIRLERAAKDWARRIRDPFAGPPPATGPRSVERHPVYEDGELVRWIELLPNAMLIEIDRSEEWSSLGGPTYIHLTADDFDLATPRLGTVILGEGVRTNDPGVDIPPVISHETGHAIGFVPTPSEPAWRAIVDFEAHTWIGRHAVAVHGGPVPLQWLDVQGLPTDPGTPGAVRDSSHVGPCTSIFSYCTTTDGPSDLDFAMMADIGFDVAPKAVGDAPELYGYGAWGEASAFAVTVERSLTYPDHDMVRARAGHGGAAPATRLADAPLGGTVTWDGFLLAVDTRTAALVPVTGDAALAVDLGTLAGQARFSALETHVDGTTSAFRHPSLEYAVAVDGNGFADAAGRIDGGFYGTGHEEMAGTLHDRAVNVLGAFGGARETPAPR